ncbi:MAG: hypothetical protein ACJ790_10820 [Myxococcaceae bacterium]
MKEQVPLSENAFVAILMGGIAMLLVVGFVVQQRRAKKLAEAEVLELPLGPSGTGMFKAIGAILAVMVVSSLALVLAMIQAKQAGFQQWPLVLAGGIIVIGAMVVLVSLRITRIFSQGSVRLANDVLEIHAPEERYQRRAFKLLPGVQVRFWAMRQTVGCDIDDSDGGVTFNFQGLTIADFKMGPQAMPGIRGAGFSLDRAAGRELFRRISRRVQGG